MSPRGIPWIDETDEAIATVLELLDQATQDDKPDEEV